MLSIESTANWLRLINLLAKRAGERSAGNLHAPFDVAGDGNQLTVRLVGTPEETGSNRSIAPTEPGAIPRPYQPDLSGRAMARRSSRAQPTSTKSPSVAIRTAVRPTR